MRAKLIYEKFIANSDPIQDMGIGDKGILIENKFEKLARKNNYNSYEYPQFTDEEDLVRWGYKNVMFIKCWNKIFKENFREIILFSAFDTFSDKTKYYVSELTEEGDTGGDEINWPNHWSLKDHYWEREP